MYRKLPRDAAAMPTALFSPGHSPDERGDVALIGPRLARDGRGRAGTPA